MWLDQPRGGAARRRSHGAAAPDRASARCRGCRRAQCASGPTRLARLRRTLPHHARHRLRRRRLGRAAAVARLNGDPRSRPRRPCADPEPLSAITGADALLARSIPELLLWVQATLIVTSDPRVLEAWVGPLSECRSRGLLGRRRARSATLLGIPLECEPGRRGRRWRVLVRGAAPSRRADRSDVTPTARAARGADILATVAAVPAAHR